MCCSSAQIIFELEIFWNMAEAWKLSRLGNIVGFLLLSSLVCFQFPKPRWDDSESPVSPYKKGVSFVRNTAFRTLKPSFSCPICAHF